MRLYLWVVIIVAVNLGVGWLLSSGPEPRRLDPRVLASDAVDSKVTYSNILPADYVGPETCAQCHDEQYQQWQTHPHHCMNQLPNPDSVAGDFNDALLTLPTADVHFTTSASGTYLITIQKESQLFRQYKVTRTVGSRYMQAYIGKQVVGPEPRDHEIYQEHRLPFTYWFKIKRWLPREYLNIHGPEPLKDGVPQIEAIDIAPVVQSYSEVCMNCHNTYPYAYRIFHPSLVGFADATVAASIEPLSHELADTVHVKPSVKSFVTLNSRLDPEEHLVTQGISCESCHLGGREHAIHEEAIRFLPTSKYTKLILKDSGTKLTSDRSNAATMRGICIQCHSGNGELFPNGAGKGNSREGMDLHAGFCKSEASCVTCHDPHAPSPGPSGFEDRLTHVQACTQCHEQYSSESAAQAHSGHAASANVNCLDCHMPRITRGIDELIRTHRIGMPVEESMVREGMANACNACHLDKSTRWTLDQLREKWNRHLPASSKWASFETLDQCAGDAWLKSSDSHMRLVATQSLARSKWSQEKLVDLIWALNDTERINRVFAEFAVCRVLGLPMDEPLPVDTTAAPETRELQIRQWLEELRQQGKLAQ